MSASRIFLSCAIKAMNKAPGRPGAGTGVSSISGGECPRDDQVQSWQGNMHKQRAFVVTGTTFRPVSAKTQVCPQELDDRPHRKRLKHKTTQRQRSKNRRMNPDQPCSVKILQWVMSNQKGRYVVSGYTRGRAGSGRVGTTKSTGRVGTGQRVPRGIRHWS